MSEISEIKRAVPLAEQDVCVQVQAACEEHLAACWTAFYAEEEADPGEEVEYPAAAGPFCGCETCVVREVLHAARPYFARLAELEAQDAAERARQS